jgi:HEPN domain-containing protein
MEDTSHKFFDEAYERLREANNELFRPEEDIVSFLVCKNAQFAMENYLKGYLLKNGVDISNCTTIHALYVECVRINPRFEKVNLEGFTCQTQDTESRSCNQVSKVSTCFNIANDLDSFLREEKVI